MQGACHREVGILISQLSSARLVALGTSTFSACFSPYEYLGGRSKGNSGNCKILGLGGDLEVIADTVSDHPTPLPFSCHGSKPVPAARIFRVFFFPAPAKELFPKTGAPSHSSLEASSTNDLEDHCIISQLPCPTARIALRCAS